jgi:uncharacterized protein YecE (DUF72 family)
MIRVGTSGYSFSDWVGIVYPAGAKPGDFLSHYARLFDTVEINATYYRIPSPATFHSMLRKVPPSFTFVVKLPREMTHEREGFARAVVPFFAAVEPLAEAGQLGGLLAQFPYSFKPEPESEEHLRRLAGEVGGRGVPVNVEVRHAAWSRDETYALLRDLGLGFVNVDLPSLRDLPGPTGLVTSEVGYVRLHGRNSRAWWGKDERARYDYLYSERELEEWRPRIEETASNSRLCYVFANNCHLGQSVVNALQLQARFQLPRPTLPTGATEEMFAHTAEVLANAIHERIRMARERATT